MSDAFSDAARRVPPVMFLAAPVEPLENDGPCVDCPDSGCLCGMDDGDDVA